MRLRLTARTLADVAAELRRLGPTSRDSVVIPTPWITPRQDILPRPIDVCHIVTHVSRA
jgi:hypothetical protein